jgi:hypothetical protein
MSATTSADWTSKSNGTRSSYDLPSLHRQFGLRSFAGKAQAADHGMVRVIDESGEDYLFERDRFLDLQLDPATAARIADLRQP